MGLVLRTVICVCLVLAFKFTFVIRAVSVPFVTQYEDPRTPKAFNVRPKEESHVQVHTDFYLALTTCIYIHI